MAHTWHFKTQIWGDAADPREGDLVMGPLVFILNQRWEEKKINV